MPRFFFHLASPDEDSPDQDGVEFPSVEAAFLDLYRAVLDISYDMLRKQRDPHRHRFDVRDIAGRPLFELPFCEVLRPSTRGRPLPHPLLAERIGERLERSRALKRDIVHEISEASQSLRKMQVLLRG